MVFFSFKFHLPSESKQFFVFVAGNIAKNILYILYCNVFLFFLLPDKKSSTKTFWIYCEKSAPSYSTVIDYGGSKI